MDSDNESFTVADHDNSGSETWMTTEDQIRKYKEMYHNLEVDRLSLERMMVENEKEARRFQEEAELLCKRLKEQEEDALSREGVFELLLEDERAQRSQLLQQKQDMEKELEQLRVSQEELKVPISYPERAMVFKGDIEEQDISGHMAKASPDLVTTAAQVQCLVSGGSALITFEDPEVASKIIAKRQHWVQLDNIYARVTAKQVVLPLPSYVKIALKQRPRKVLVSGLEAVPMNDDHLFDKVALFFSRRQNGGDEVSCVEKLSSGHLVLTFEDSGVAKRLIRRGRFQVPLGKETYEVKVSHYIDGDIAELQVHRSVCARTILLTEIPNVLDEELTRSYLMIHFQKPSKGGGEVEAVVYIPDGQNVLAVFEGEKD